VVRPPTSAPSSRPTTGPRPEREPAFARRVGAHRAHSAAWRRSKQGLPPPLQSLTAPLSTSLRGGHSPIAPLSASRPAAATRGGTTGRGRHATGGGGSGIRGRGRGRERHSRGAGAGHPRRRRTTHTGPPGHRQVCRRVPAPACGAPVPARASPAASTPLARRLPPLTAPFSGPYGGRQGREHRPQGTVGIGRLAAARGLALRLLCHPPVGRTPTDDAW